jgi:hypothetical protein
MDVGGIDMVGDEFLGEGNFCSLLRVYNKILQGTLPRKGIGLPTPNRHQSKNG